MLEEQTSCHLLSACHSSYHPSHSAPPPPSPPPGLAPSPPDPAAFRHSMPHEEQAAVEGALQPWLAHLPAWRVQLRQPEHVYTVQGDWARAHYGLPTTVLVTPCSRRMVSATGLLASCFPPFDADKVCDDNWDRWLNVHSSQSSSSSIVLSVI